MRLYVVRHGDKERGSFPNARLGHQDQPLSEIGRVQARGLASFLADKAITSIRVSEYIRAAETIAPFLADTGLRASVDPLLNEIDTGSFDGLDAGEAAARFPDFWRCYREKSVDFAYPGGESGADVLARIRTALGTALTEPGNKVFVTHEGWAKLAMCHVLGLAPEKRFRFQVDTCGILELETTTEPPGLVVRRFNHTLLS